MKFILLFGPQAVGKMTVGHALAHRTGFKLFHNHMTLEMLSPIFDFGEETWRLSDLFRMEIFQAAARSNLQGLIFTYVWAFSEPRDWEYVQKVCRIFEDNGADIYWVELASSVETRLERNKTPFRLEHKPSKRNIEFSDHELQQSMEKYRLNSEPGEITRHNYLRIDNTNLSPDDVAERIIAEFKL